MSSDLASAGHGLAALLTQENDALKRMDFDAAAALAPAKEAALAELIKQPKAAMLTPPLIALARLLSGLAAENELLLQRAIEVQTRIVRIVARAGTPQPGATQYGGYGKRAPSQRAIALAVSTRA